MSYLITMLNLWHLFGTGRNKLKPCTIPLKNQPFNLNINPINNFQK
jgi:hypothetical protein